jgi:hypothetical protein
MKIFASDSWLVAPVMRTQSSSEILPLRMLLSGTWPIEAEHARDQLLGGHFHAEDRDRGLGVRTHRRVLGHVDRQRGLAHRGAAGDDHQIPAAQAAGDAVEIREARRQTAQLVRIGVPLIDLDR